VLAEDRDICNKYQSQPIPQLFSGFRATQKLLLRTTKRVKNKNNINTTTMAAATTTATTIPFGIYLREYPEEVRPF
jgi:hypothetical protein